MTTFRINIKGLVQGVGFRPFVYRVAHRHKLLGWVENNNDGVVIESAATFATIERFIDDIKNEAPPASKITSLTFTEIQDTRFNDFVIRKSGDNSDAITDVCPDIAVCSDCLADIKKQKNRINYPMVNCTNCGPRFTIIKELPYDRHKTTMQEFVMCPDCNSEYTDVLDRRFHAQPVACNTCGPHYSMTCNGRTIENITEILDEAARLLCTGHIIAIKGTGGFHLVCDAFDINTLLRLRGIKGREGKPFAIMCRNIEAAERIAFVNSAEKEILDSWRRPVVLLKSRLKMPVALCSGLDSIGIMLPSMPFHHLLFEKTSCDCLVYTSGNVSGEPIITDNSTAHKVFGSKVDAIIDYNRIIYNRTDDSVCKVINGNSVVFRRSRGYAPVPVNLQLNVDGIIATGAELVNTFCIGKKNQAIQSQYIGDLQNIETLDFYEESMQRHLGLFRVKPELIVSDLHPDYLSTKFGEKLNLPSITVQHHHAHIASCMAEHGLDEKVIGVAYDGTGLGDDNRIWGSEIMVADLSQYTRVCHLDYIQLPGGDKAADQPWRTGFSVLYKYFGREALGLNIPFVKSIQSERLEMMIQSMEKGINCPESCGAGRWFDAVAAITNLVSRSTFHAEAPMKLEAVAAKNLDDYYPYRIDTCVSLEPAIKQIVKDIQQGIPVSVISAKFHNTIVNSAFDVIKKTSMETGIIKVALSGGVMQNKVLNEKLTRRLLSDGILVYNHEAIPPNDGGLSLGQLVIAAKRRELKFVNN